MRLLIFSPAILIPSCVSSSPAFLMMYAAYKLNKQDDNIQPWHTPFLICNQSVVPWPVLTVVSWPLRGRSGALVFPSLEEFSIVCGDPHSQTLIVIVNKGEVDVFLELSCFFHDPADVGNLISGSSAFSKTSLYIWKFTVHVLLKPGLENFEHYFTSMWDECNCAVVWAFFVIAFLWDWNENWPFPILWPLLSFPNLLAYWVKQFHNIISYDLK